MNKLNKVIISGGGTGGHIYPAIAIANALKAQDSQTEILFVGAEGRMEMEKVPKAGYKIVGLPIAGLQRRLTLKNLWVPFKLVASLWKARSVIKNFQPDAVIGVGGYASAPLLWIAEKRGIPSLIQEQNSYAGLTNKILSKKVNSICVAYPNMERYFPKDKITFTGNPVRQDLLVPKDKNIARATFQLSENKPTILVIGGSLGARTINESLIQGINTLLDAGVQVIWQTGKFYFEKCKTAIAQIDTKNSLFINDFIYNMDDAYAAADVVISRAGALSVSELCVAKKAAILVPSPNVAEDHQTKNAMALVENEAAVLVKDTEAQEKLISTSLELITNQEQQNQLEQHINQLAKPDAAKHIAQKVYEIAGKTWI